MPDGAYRLGSQHIHKCLGAVRLADGTLGGSILTMDQALRNLVAFDRDITQQEVYVEGESIEMLSRPTA